jgi:hypothetical protein
MSVRQFAERFKGEMIPLSSTISYYCASTPLSEEDIKDYLQEPIAALPPSIAKALPKISILLVPYIEKTSARENGKARKEATEYVSVDKPPEGRRSDSTQVKIGEETVLAFALKDSEVAEYHYRLYHLLATVIGESWTEEIEVRYSRLLREELLADVHGEVDEDGWRLKQGLRRTKAGRYTGSSLKTMREYTRQSFIDTLTLYLHGICCDIDVDTGPRQLPSRHLRKRLMLLEEMFPPPQGYAVFPEQLQP